MIKLNESVNEAIEPSGIMAKINKIVQDKQAAKISGVLVDKFSAGIMMQIFNAVNDKAKKDMNKGNIRQVQVILHKVMKQNRVRESVSEGFTSSQLGKLRNQMKGIGRVNPSGPTYKKLTKLLDVLSISELQQIAKADIKFMSLLAKNTPNISHIYCAQQTGGQKHLGFKKKISLFYVQSLKIDCCMVEQL